MRKVYAMVLTGLLLLLASSLVLADLRDFSGRWVNTDPDTRGITALNIDAGPGRLAVQAWGQAQPGDIDWGTAPAYSYASSVSDNPFQGAQAITALFQTSFNETLLLIRAQGAELQVESFTRFTDRSGRSNYQAFYRFRRGGHWPGQMGPGHEGPWREGPGSEGPGPHGPQWLETPQQMAPRSGSLFHHYPRRTMLSWSPVNGARYYGLEVDYFDSGWVTERGQTYLIVPNLTGTNYTFNFVGAQPGRWRVWAIGPGGQESLKSDWWEFRYTR